MIVTTRIVLASTLAAMTVSCTSQLTPVQNTQSDTRRTTTTLRRPALQGLPLREGLNLIDRTPSGASLVARVKGDEITEWQVFHPAGPIALLLQKKKDDGGGDLNYCQVCALTGGTCGIVVGGEGGIACCWDDWGCQLCDFDGENCMMQCETQKCRDANNQPGNGGDAPDDGDVATVVPDGSRAFFDASESRWTLTRPGGEAIHVPVATSRNTCTVCTDRPGDNTCWALPCLPVKTSTYAAPRP